MNHELKINKDFFRLTKEGKMNFQIRKNDRDYKVGDFLVLKEWNGENFSEEELKAEITCVIDYQQRKGYVVLGINLISKIIPKTPEYLYAEVFRDTCELVLNIERNINKVNNKYLELLPKLLKEIINMKIGENNNGNKRL